MNPVSINKSTIGIPDRQQPSVGETVRKERKRLLSFIRRRLPDPADAEDALQDVFMELTEAYQLAKPIGRVVASWLFAVARGAQPEPPGSPDKTNHVIQRFNRTRKLTNA